MDFHDFEARYLARLNPQQREAVLAPAGPVLVLATPGSGKTSVLVTRIGYLLFCCGVSPASVLTMTYTRAAAADMRARFSALFGEELGRKLQFRTINGVSAAIINRAARAYGRSPFPLLHEEGLRNRILRDAVWKLTSVYPDDFTLREIGTSITYIKNMLLTDEEIDRRVWGTARLPEIWRLYQAELRQRRLMDYDDQMVYALRLLQRIPELCSRIQDQYRWLLVDEAQDTSKVQHEIVRCLSGKYDNLFMVGDEDQSIYAFRGACPDALMRFSLDHPRAKTVIIRENYRSTAEIVRAARLFVSRNRFRHPKEMVSARGSGLPVRLIRVKNRRAQFDWLFSHRDLRDSDTAVLFRNHDSALPLVDRLQQAGIPFRCRTDEDTFFLSRTVQDTLDIMRFAESPDDRELFLRIYYKFSLGLSRNAAHQAVEKGGNLMQALLAVPDLTPAAQNGVLHLINQLQKLRQDSAEKALSRIWDAMQYRKYAERLGQEKYFTLCMLALGVSSPASFLTKLDRLRESLSTHENIPRQGVVLSTIHASKGLEYRRVFLLDIIDGILPSLSSSEVRSDAEIRAYEEDRRLFYVAMTRAKDELCIFLPEDKASFPRELAGLLASEKSLPLWRKKHEKNHTSHRGRI